MKKNKNKIYYTFDEYKKQFFPKKSKIKDIENDDPTKFGITLAQSSLSKIKNILKK
ncbi:MAG: hypothetical protein KAU01_00765 [Candidatus Cloacimonetes bacterium]|nr:hypothetical protein [Candidatus Cloacimonadota bacterium]